MKDLSSATNSYEQFPNVLSLIYTCLSMHPLPTEMVVTASCQQNIHVCSQLSHTHSCLNSDFEFNLMKRKTVRM